MLAGVPPAVDPNKLVVEIFCSYAHEDEGLRKDFDKLLEPLKRQKLIELWHDRRIEAGERFAGVIDDHLNSADIIVLLVSRDFLASDYSCSKEVPRAMEREAQGKARVVPLIVRACDWTDEPFGALNAIPTDGRAVESWPKIDEAWLDVKVHIKTAVRTILELRKQRLQQEMEAAAKLAQEREQQASKAAAKPATPDQLEAQEIYAQIARDAEKFKLERERIMKELQTRIFAIERDTEPAKRVPKKSAKDAFKAMDAYIREE
jgi:hypothetical protein